MQSSRKSVHYISFPPPLTTSNEAFVTSLTSLINDAFTDSKSIFGNSYVRIQSPGVKELILAGRLALATTSEDYTNISPEDVVGCINISQYDDQTGSFGMLTTRPHARGTGIGRQLVAFAESHCLSKGATKMRIDLVVPTTIQAPLKVQIQKWYERMNYRKVAVEDLAEHLPQFAKMLITPIEYRIFEKRLVDRAEEDAE